MNNSLWTQFFKGEAPFEGRNRFHLNAYSEFMPPPRLGINPYTGEFDPRLLDPQRPSHWRIPEVQEICELRPGLEHIAQIIGDAISTAMAGGHYKGISQAELAVNPYWPGVRLPHPSAMTMLLPLALSKTQDDKGRVRWTLFGSSQLGPDAAFWKSFFRPDGSELPAKEGIDFLRNFLDISSGEAPSSADGLRNAGLRILPRGSDSVWREPELPTWTKELYLSENDLASGSLKVLLTFKSFSSLPESIKDAARAGKIRLLPSPETLIFWDHRIAKKLEVGLLHATQIPLLLLFLRHEGVGLRIPQSGLLHEGSRESAPQSPSLHNNYRRSSRHDRHMRHMDILQFEGREAALAKTLFSSLPGATGLYDKPMARNAQLWTSSFRPVLDGPVASPGEILCARSAVLRGGTFGYRFLFPAMRLADFEVFWHRPLAATFRAGDKFKSSEVLFNGAPSGIILAERCNGAAAEKIEFQPSFDLRPERLSAAKLILSGAAKPYRKDSAEDALHILAAAEELEGRITEDAAAKVAMLKSSSIAHLCESIAKSSGSEEESKIIISALEKVIDKKTSRVPQPLTFNKTASRKFELDYWDTIRHLSSADFQNKNNADCILDEASAKTRQAEGRGLDELADILLARHWAAIKKTPVPDAFAGEIPFVWDGIYNFDWQEGWLDNRLGRKRERNLICVIPGRDRSKAVILADHYDTAFMEDIFAGNNARIAAAGADDNHSATATLLLAAPIFLELAKEGKLGCDVWLVHLTGEEFPADCMGARMLSQLLVERRLAAMLDDGTRIDLSKASVQALFVMDMIAHNNEKEPDIFQISPGAWPGALKAAMHAHFANEIWNSLVHDLNSVENRTGLQRPPRSTKNSPPPTGPFVSLSGQIRLHDSRKSSLYNTDGQVFSDAGLPAVLIMENYDLNRHGYHDTHDTMENIDLDYGAAIAAISIEATAQAAQSSA